jgi:putative DNA primase/helicase
LTYLYCDRLIYDHAEKQWYLWGGHYWLADRTAKVRRLIEGQLAAQYLMLSAQMSKELAAAEQNQQEGAAGGDTDVEKIKRVRSQIQDLKERAAQLRNLRRIQRILEFAGSFMGLAGDEWDQKPALLACPNGVINLRTGVLSPVTRRTTSVAPAQRSGRDWMPRHQDFSSSSTRSLTRLTKNNTTLAIIFSK